MRFLVIVKASEESEKGTLPTQEEWEAMGKFNDELVKAGVMLAAEGLLPSKKGVRVRFGNPKEKPVVTDGPFPETKELVAGFWIWKCASMQEAIQWIQKAPFAQTEIEIRQIGEMEDFGDAVSPEIREEEKRLRQEADKLAAKTKIA